MAPTRWQRFLQRWMFSILLLPCLPALSAALQDDRPAADALIRNGLASDQRTQQVAALRLLQVIVAEQAERDALAPNPRRGQENVPNVSGVSTALVRFIQGNPDPALRRDAVALLGATDPDLTEAVPLLESLLTGSNPALRQASAQALHGLYQRWERLLAEDILILSEETLPLLQIAVNDPTPNVLGAGIEAATVLGEAEAEALNRLRTQFADDMGRLRVQIERSETNLQKLQEDLDSARDPMDRMRKERELNTEKNRLAKLLESKTQLLSTAEGDLKRYRAANLARTSVIEGVGRGLAAADPATRLAAAFALQELALSRTRATAYRQEVNSASGDVVRFETDSLHWVANQPEMLPEPGDLNEGTPVRDALIQTLRTYRGTLADPVEQVREEYLAAIEGLGKDAAPLADVLVQATHDRSPFVRWAAARSLGKIAKEQAGIAVPALAGLANDVDLGTREAAMVALRRYGDAAHAAASQVAESMRRGDLAPRLSAILTLDALELPTAELIGYLLPVVTQPEEPTVNVGMIRWTAIRVLSTIDPAELKAHAATLIPALEQAMNDPEEEVRRAASETLLIIGYGQ